MFIKRGHTHGFAHLAWTTNQMRLPFDNDIVLAPQPAVSSLTTSGSNYRVEAAPRP